MLSTSKVRAIACAVTIVALSLQGLSPATAADPEGTNEPATEPTVAPAETPAPVGTPAAPGSAQPVEVEDAEETEAPSDGPAENPVDVVLPDRTISVPLPLPPLPLPLNLGSLNLSPQAAPTAADPQFGGSASGVYAEALASDEIRVKAGVLGAVSMRPDGAAAGNTAAYVFMPTLHLPALIALPLVGIRAEGVSVYAWGGFTFRDKRPWAAATTEVEDVGVQIYAAVLTAQNLHVHAYVERLADGQYKFQGTTKFGHLSFYGAVPFDSKEIEPNRTHIVPGLGKVVLNEQKITDLPGDRHGIRVTAIHITLSTAVGTWPVGTDIYIGNAEAIIYE